jgi:hypothetical protein
MYFYKNFELSTLEVILLKADAFMCDIRTEIHLHMILGITNTHTHTHTHTNTHADDRWIYHTHRH